MFEYEYGKADYDLDEVKEKLLNYLKKCKYLEKDTEKAAMGTFKYLEKIVDSVLKSKAVKIEFSSGGSPLWHSTIFYYLSRWIAAENKIGRILAKELDDQLDDESPFESDS